ncbi:MAG: NTP transferase domain-containing protein [Candidatus Kariarchaeaceae archaeon]
MKFDVALLAGYNPKNATLLEHARQLFKKMVDKKALIPIQGEKTLIQFVVDALNASKYVGTIVIVGSDPIPGLKSEAEVEYLAIEGPLFDKTLAVAKYLEKKGSPSRHVISCSADIPLISGKMIDQWVAKIKEMDSFESDFYFSFINKEAMERRFPGSGRTYPRFSDGEFCGGDMHLADPRIVIDNQGVFSQLLASRKSFWKLSKIIGLRTLIRYLFRRLSVADAEKKLSKAISAKARAVTVPFAEMAMDVDKPYQLDIVLEELNNLKTAGNNN